MSCSMAHLDLSPATVPLADPHQSTVSAIQRGVRLGLFTAAEADLMIDRVRARVTRSPFLLEGGNPFAGSGHVEKGFLNHPDRTVL